MGRYRAEGEAGLVDRSSAPASCPLQTPEDRVAAIAALRRVRLTGPEIAEVLGMACSTVSGILKRIGLGKLSRFQPPESPNRYEKSSPGELVHIDVKKLGRISTRGAGHRVTGQRNTHRKKPDTHWQRRGDAGWEFVHVCVDEYSRLAHAEVLCDEQATTAIAFLGRCLAFYAAHGIRVQAVMTDNGSAYRSTIHAIACRARGLKHIRTRPARSRTNGKAERFIRTMLREWAYAAIYATGNERPPTYPAGSTGTTPHDHTAASATSPRPPD